jgi:hypothetical protein
MKCRRLALAFGGVIAAVAVSGAAVIRPPSTDALSAPGAPAAAAANDLFEGCGELFQGVECVLFAADAGGVYLLENLDGFGVGDRVLVSGLLDPDCFTICLEGDGCIFENAILACEGPGPFAGCGELVQGVECVLFQSDFGGLFLLENLDGFDVGDRVFVAGILDPDCVTICLEGDGCIFENVILSCAPGQKVTICHIPPGNPANAHEISVSINALPAHLAHGDTIGPCQAPPVEFEGCGTLVQGVECVLFQADEGGLYLLDNLDGFGVGDRVFVSGILDPTCFTICLEGDGCIFGNTIEACVEPFEGCGTLVQGVECVLFQADEGGLYLLENLDGFGVGDRVFVTGVPDPDCVSFCQQEDACIFGNTIEPCVFEGCGELIQGVECVLFQADAGGLYLLDNLDGFGVGDRVLVSGILDPTCFTICLEGDGCIFETVIGPCP